MPLPWSLVVNNSRLRYVAVCLLVCIALWTVHHSQRSVHPILQLIADAELQHASTRQSQPKTLDEAVQRYRLRHGREPPPHYDHWFATAQRVNACTTEGFDDMYNALEVFHALSPSEIKTRMDQLAPIRGMGRVRVHNGRVLRHDELESAQAGSGGEDSDARRAMQSMLEAVVGEFQAELPDIDMFVNGYDEPRVSLPHDLRVDFERMASAGQARPQVDEPLILRSFGGNASLADKIRQTCQDTRIDCPTAWETLRMACPPDSAARKVGLSPLPGSNPVTTHRYDRAFTTAKGHFLTAPVVEHATWCNQPDLQDLHAAYIHPLSFTFTQQPYPVFSNSRIGGFHDILIPSWWYWFEVTKYREESDPEWKDKSDKVFWRGSNTGGYSISLAYKGWLRSRAVSRTNPPSHWNAQAPVVVADARGNAVDAQIPLHPLLSSHSDIAFVSPDQGDPSSVASQRFEPTFRFADRAPFEDNYRTKAVLDLDGTAYSGRFLALMHSRTAVFKAGLFREALSHSLVPWYHYVPISVRLTDMPSILGFFFGVESVKAFLKGTGRARVESGLAAASAHDEALRLVGERGREWASQCARRQDMMLYTYLLALEWARILHR